MKKLSPKGKLIIEIVILVSIVSVTFLFWDSFAIYPIKLFVVLLHESSHCVTSLITGATVSEIKIDYDTGGACICEGGFPYLIALSGYIGSLILGGLFFISAKYKKFSLYYCTGIAAGLLLIAIFFIKNMFGIVFTIAFVAILTISPRILPDFIHSYFVKIIGAISCLYILVDIKDDLLTTYIRRSDAQILAELTGVDAWVWGMTIMLVSVIIMYFLVKFNFRSSGTKQKPLINDVYTKRPKKKRKTRKA